MREMERQLVSTVEPRKRRRVTTKKTKFRKTECCRMFAPRSLNHCISTFFCTSLHLMISCWFTTMVCGCTVSPRCIYLVAYIASQEINLHKNGLQARGNPLCPFQDFVTCDWGSFAPESSDFEQHTWRLGQVPVRGEGGFNTSGCLMYAGRAQSQAC